MLAAIHKHSAPRSRRNGIAPLGLCIVMGAACLGCAPIRKHVSGISETRQKLDLSFLQAGTTTRQEVLEKLDWINTGVTEERLFIGRWSAYSLDLVLGWAPPPFNVAPQSQETWKPNNLLVEFDAQGIVKQFRVLSDSDFLKELSSWIQRNAPTLPPFIAPSTITVKHRHALGKYHFGELTLGADSIEYHESDDASHNFTLPRGQLGALTYPSTTPGDTSNPRMINCRLKFREATKAGSHLTLAMTVSSLFTLIEYVEQNRTGSVQHH